MRVIQAPEHVYIYENETPIFLAGGISGCSNWQKEMITLLKASPTADSMVLLNPRRDNFDVNDEKMAKAQIEWEFDHLRKAEIILFWFPAETVCPITLFELGYWLGCTTPKKKIFVGTNPLYSRRFDLEIQTKLLGAKMDIYRTLESLSQAVSRAIF